MGESAKKCLVLGSHDFFQKVVSLRHGRTIVRSHLRMVWLNGLQIKKVTLHKQMAVNELATFAPE